MFYKQTRDPSERRQWEVRGASPKELSCNTYGNVYQLTVLLKMEEAIYTCPKIHRNALWKQVGNCSEISYVILKQMQIFAFHFIILCYYLHYSKISKIENLKARALFILGILIFSGTCFWVISRQFLYFNLSHNSTEKKKNPTVYHNFS